MKKGKKMIKKFIIMVSVVCFMAISNISAFAQQIGYVDTAKILSSYDKAQEFEADQKVKQAELQKYIAEARKNIKAAKTQTEAKNLESKYSKELDVKKDEYSKQLAKDWELIQKTVIDAIKTAAASKKIDVVFKKESLLTGGIDLTPDVLNILAPSNK